MNSKNHTVEERALMQRVWNDSSQATQAKELCAEPAKLRRTMTRTNPDRTSQKKNKKRPVQEKARMDRIRADAYHAAQTSVRDEKGKATERIALNGIEDDFRLPLLLLILKLILLGNRLEQNKIMDRTGEQE